MKKLLLGLVLTMFAMQANAATFDFAWIADNVAPGEHGATTLNFNSGSLGLAASATDVATEKAVYNAYLDEGNAGLGVCKSIDTNSQCTPSSDDNVTFGEVLRLDFSDEVLITSIAFLDGHHGTDFKGNFDVAIDGGVFTSYALVDFFISGLQGQSFLFANNNNQGLGTRAYKEQFYISALSASAVPVPAAVWLFGSALMGLFGVSRRKSTAVAA